MDIAIICKNKGNKMQIWKYQLYFIKMVFWFSQCLIISTYFQNEYLRSVFVVLFECTIIYIDNNDKYLNLFGKEFYFWFSCVATVLFIIYKVNIYYFLIGNSLLCLMVDWLNDNMRDLQVKLITCCKSLDVNDSTLILKNLWRK